MEVDILLLITGPIVRPALFSQADHDCDSEWVSIFNPFGEA